MLAAVASVHVSVADGRRRSSFVSQMCQFFTRAVRVIAAAVVVVLIVVCHPCLYVSQRLMPAREVSNDDPQLSFCIPKRARDKKRQKIVARWEDRRDFLIATTTQKWARKFFSATRVYVFVPESRRFIISQKYNLPANLAIRKFPKNGSPLKREGGIKSTKDSGIKAVRDTEKRRVSGVHMVESKVLRGKREWGFSVRGGCDASKKAYIYLFPEGYARMCFFRLLRHV